MTVGRRGHFARLLDPLTIAPPLVVGEEKQPVFLDRPSCRAPEYIANQLGLLIWLTIFQLGPFVEVVVRREGCVSVVFIGRTVKGIRATLGHQRYLRSRGTARVGIGVACGHAEFLNGVLRVSKNARERVPLALIVDVNPVERHVRLVTVRPIY